MATELKTKTAMISLPPQEIAARGESIHRALLAKPKGLESANFRDIHPDHLQRLFDLYDDMYLDGACRRALGNTRLAFKLSKRMTSAGGKTSRFTPHDTLRQPWYEIAVSTTLLFHTFEGSEAGRPITVCGLQCTNRLEALQRVFEHEMIHLVEMLAWTKSNCSQRRYQSMSSRIFGHTDYRHRLVTPREKAAVEFGIRAGDRVRFRFDGVERVGLVNRIHSRATVLVEDPSGPRYNDGKHYQRFYVPLALLKRVN